MKDMSDLRGTYLVIRFSSLGNVAMAVPVLASVAEAHKDARFVVLAKKRLEDLFGFAENVEYVCADSDKNKSKTRSIFSIYKDLKKYNIAGVVDLQDCWKSKLLRGLFRLRGKKVSVIRTRKVERWRLCRKGYWQTDALPTEFEEFANTFHRAGLELGQEFVKLPTDESARESVEEKFGEKRGKWIGIAPFAKSKTNMLPYRIIKEVIAYFAGKSEVRVFLFGAGKVECDMLRQWSELHDNVECVAGCLRLAEELELMRELDVMLCMDSANQHLASLVGLRCISVWCGTHPYAGFYGWKQQESDVLQQPLSCRPCTIHGRNKCKYRNFLCRQFTSAQIIKMLEESL